MKVLILHASPRKKGVTSTLLTEIESTVASEHAVEVVRIHDLNMTPCLGCMKCRPDKTCILPEDDAHTLADKVKESDVLVIGSPVYWGNMPGSLKIFFDRNVPLFEYAEATRMNTIPTPQLKGKKAILIIASASPFPYHLLKSQSRGTIRALKTILASGGMKIERVLNIPDSHNFGKKKQKYLKKGQNIGKSI